MTAFLWAAAPSSGLGLRGASNALDFSRLAPPTAQSRPLPGTANGLSSVAINIAAGAVAGAAGALLSGGRRRAARRVFGQYEDEGESYIVVLVETKDFGIRQVEAKPSDPIKVIKAMLSMDTGVPEDDQILTLNGEDLYESDLLKDMDIVEGTKLKLDIRQDVEDEGQGPGEVPEGCIRVIVRCDTTPGKQKAVAMDLEPHELIGDIKAVAFEEMKKIQQGYGRLGPQAFALAIPNEEKYGPLSDEKGNPRRVEREERFKDNHSAEEAGLKGGETLIMVHSCFFNF